MNLRSSSPLYFATILQSSPLMTACNHTETTSDLDEAPFCTLGTGSLVFEAVMPGAMLPVISGPKEAIMYGRVCEPRARTSPPGDYDNPDNPQTRFDVFLADGTRIGGTAQLRVGLKVRSDGSMEHVGEPVILAISVPFELAGQSGSIHVEIVDSQGRMIGDDVGVVFDAGGR